MNKSAKIRLDDHNVIDIAISDMDNLENDSVIGTFLLSDKLYEIKIAKIDGGDS